MDARDLEARKLEIEQAFATVLEVIDLFTEAGDVPPAGVYSYLWKKKWKLQDVSFVVEN